jgi:hypothetical protein
LREGEFVLLSGNLEIVYHGCGAQPPLALPHEANTTENITMTESGAPVRADVERMLERYVRLEYFGVRSAAGAMVIDESRVSKKAVSLREDASEAETLDAIHTALIRRAVYAPHARRIERGRDGRPLNTVARGSRDVVSGKGRGGSGTPAATDRGAQLWKASVAAKLRAIPKGEERAVIQVAVLRLQLVEIRNQLQSARSEVERLKGAKREARNLRRHAEHRRAELRSREEMKSDQLCRLVRTRLYRDGWTRLWYLVTADAEVRAYLFRE